MIKICKNIFTILILLVFSISIKAQVLNVPEITQQENQWCWIGTSLSVLQYYGDTQLSQCQIATWAWGKATWRTCNDNCCSNSGGCCNYWNYNWGKAGAIDDILKNVSSQVSISVNNISGSISQSQVSTAISDGRPMIVRVNSGGHFITVHGLEGNTLYYMDPWYGEGKGYQTFSTSQVNGRSWTHTQVCLTKPNNNPQPPSKATNPNPYNNAVNVSLSTSLSWTAGSGTDSHKVYFGTSSSPAYQGSQAGSSFNPGSLNESTTYYWRVDEVNSEGTTTGDLWRFTTGSGTNPSDKTVGNTSVYSQNTTAANRRAMPFTMPENGTITSIAQYHQGGSGSMYLAVYEGTSTAPTNRIAVTAVSNVSSVEGWQTVNLTSPVQVSANQTIWLAWVYENTPGIAYKDGSPGRVDAGVAWSGGMPGSWGNTANQSNYIYSIYANYTPGGTTPTEGIIGNNSIYSSTTTAANRRAAPYTMSENGTLTSISQYHQGGSGNVVLAVYEGSTSPTNRIAVTPVTPVNASSGWQTINLSSPVNVSSGQKIWLAWVYENTPNIAYTNGTPGRVDAGVGYSGGMPSYWGSTASQANYIYSIYAEYTTARTGSGETSIVPVETFTMYPNPTHGQVTICYSGKSSVVKIISITGAVVKEQQVEEGENFIDISSLAKGIYFVNIKDTGKGSQKLVIQ